MRENLLYLVILWYVTGISGCMGQVEAPNDAYKVSDLYSNQFHSFRSNPDANRSNSSFTQGIWIGGPREIKVYGKVDHLGDFVCPCFELTSGKKSVVVWFAGMEENGRRKPAVDISGIENGDWVTVTGELRIDVSKSMYEFWASSIEKIE